MNPSRLIHIFIAFFLLISSYSESVSTSLDMQISLSYGNYHKQDKWLPLNIILSNKSGEFNGEIVAEIQSNNSGDKNTYSMPVSIYGDTKKAKCLYIYPDRIYSNINIKLKDNQNNAIIEKEFRINFINPESRLVAIISQNSVAHIPIFPSDKLEKDKQFQFLPISAEKLPDRWKGYDSIDAVVINGISEDILSDQQKEALLNWVFDGGRLILSGGVNSLSYDGTFIEKLVPVEIYGTRTTSSIPSLSSLFEYDIPQATMVIASSKLAGKGKALLSEEDGTPVIAEKNVGSGKCIFLSFDYSDPAFKSWLGNESLWNYLIPEPTKADDDKYSAISRLISSQKHLKLPSYKAIGGLMLAYILFLNISGYIILRRSGKKSLVWLSTMVITLFFVLCSWGFSYTIKGKSLFINDFSVINIYQDNKTARITSYFSPLSFTKTNLIIDFPNAIFIERPIKKDTESYWNGDFKISQDEIYQLDILDTKFLSSHFLYGDSHINFNGNIDLIDSKTNHLKIVNNTLFNLTDCFLIIDDSYAQIKILSSMTESEIGLKGYTGNFFDTYSMEDTEKEKFFNAVKASLHDKISDKTLIGWIDGSALKILAGMNVNKAFRSSGMALVIINL